MAEAGIRPASIRSARRPAAGGPARAGVERGLWHRPALLNLISDLLTLGAAVALGWALVIWFVSRPLFPLRELVVLTAARARLGPGGGVAGPARSSHRGPVG